MPLVLEIAEESAPARRARRVDPRLHEPGRDRHPGAARRRASTPSGCATSRSGSSAASPGTSASTPERVALDHVGPQPPVVDPGGPGGRRRPAAGAARGRRRDGDPRRRLPARRSSGRWARSRPTTCATTTRPTTSLRRAARGREPGDRRHPHRARAPRPVPRPDARPQARAARAPRRRLLQRGRRGADRVAPHRRRRGPRRRRPQRAARSPTCPTTRSSRCPARIDRSGATPIPTAPLAPEMLGLVQHVKAYEPLAIEAAMSGEDAIALRALVANPLVKGDVPATSSRRSSRPTCGTSPASARRPSDAPRPGRAARRRPAARSRGPPGPARASPGLELTR